MSRPPFAKVLVANRGEIACRMIRTLKSLGIASVAIHHHQDRRAPHVAMADEAVAIDGVVPSGAYLDGAAIVAACRRTGAEAIHPGYGFLAENADFAAQVAEAGLAFIGPDAATIRLMGDKIAARRFAAAQGLAIAPSVDQQGSLDDFARAAAAIGLPLLIKAAAGGGGKGMRIVRDIGALADSARMAAGEAERYFRDGRLYAERLIDRPRHIEVQVLGDGTGRVVHLHERECSLQRRYQKVVEETPAPNLAQSLRAAICEAAVRVTAAARYRNAGTVEFVLAPDGQFFFLEMNTRLQVEHPVTEMVLGLDLVAEQLHIAAGGGLRFTQSELVPRGHAMECRICAEQPERDHQPATGRIGLLRVPVGDGLRFDGGIAEGQVVTPDFDSMLAKLIAWGEDRASAIDRLADGLGELAVLGLPTNVDYLGRVLAHREFRAGRLHTGFLAEHVAALAPAEAPAGAAAAAVVAALLADPGFRLDVLDTPEPYASIGRWRN